MATLRPEVIDVQFVEVPSDAPERSRVERAADRARSIAGAFDRLGAPDLAHKARGAANVLEDAQRAADAAKPALGALESLRKSLEDSGILRFADRSRTLGRKT